MKNKEKEMMMRKRYVQNLSLAKFLKPYSELSKIGMKEMGMKKMGKLKEEK